MKKHVAAQKPKKQKELNAVLLKKWYDDGGQITAKAYIVNASKD